MSDLETTSAPCGGHLDARGRPGRLVVLRTAEQTESRLVEVEAICEPGPPGVPERCFVGHTVSFDALEGRLSIGIDGVERVLRPGQTLELAPGTPHRIWVEAGGPPARFVWQMRPAPDSDDFADLVFGCPEPRSTD